MINSITTKQSFLKMDNLFIFDLPTHLPNEIPKKTELTSKIQKNVSVGNEPNNQNHLTHHNDDDDDDDDKEEENDEHEEKTLPKAYTNETIYIQGTNISLQTEEDIAKWIEERKRNWPTNKNIELKRQQQQQQQKDNDNDIIKTDNINKRKNDNESSNTLTKKLKSINICRFYQLNKKCKFGNKCKNLHEQQQQPQQHHQKQSINENPITSTYNELTHYRKFINGIPILIPKLYSNRTENTLMNKLSLFKHLVSKDHMTNENEKVIEFIKWLNDHGIINHDVMK